MRQKAYLRGRYRALLHSLAEFLLVIGGLHLVPLLLIPFYPDEAYLAGGFVLAGIPLMAFALIVRRTLGAKDPLNLSLQEGSVIVVAMWIVTILVSAIPFMVNLNMTLPQALFESSSGYTGTGITVVDVTTTPNIMLFFRSFIQLAGGTGFAIIVLGAGAGGGALWGLVAAEGRTDQLAPHVRETASIVLRIYSAYVIFGIIALRVAGMSWFDAINHAFTALATGGFSTKAQSIGYWDSALIEGVIIILMILGTTNFLVAYTLFQRKFRAATRNGELRLMLVVCVVATVSLYFIVTRHVYEGDKALRVAVFETVSAISNAGFNLIDYRAWFDFGWLVLIALMLIGGGTGSTAGGIKQMRVYILYKSIMWEIKRAFMPRHAVNEPAIWQGERRELLNDRLVRQTALFIGMYVFVFLLGSAVMTAYGYPLRDSLFEVSSALGNVGMSVGIIRPDMPPELLVFQAGLMLLGRLEIFAVIVGILKVTSDIPTLVRRDKAPA